MKKIFVSLACAYAFLVVHNAQGMEKITERIKNIPSYLIYLATGKPKWAQEDIYAQFTDPDQLPEDLGVLIGREILNDADFRAWLLRNMPSCSIKTEGGQYAVFSLDGKKLAVSAQGAITVTDTSCTVLHTLEVAPSVSSLIFSPDSSSLLAILSNETAQLLDLITKNTQTIDNVKAAAFTLDGKDLILGGSDGTIRAFNTAQGKNMYELAHGNDAISSIALSPDGRKFASSSFDGVVKVWQTSVGSLLHTLRGDSPTQKVLFSPDGKYLVTVSRGKAQVFDVERGVLLHTVVDHIRASIKSIVMSPQGKSFITASGDQPAKEWNIASGTLIREIGDKVLSVAISPDGSLIATGGWDTKVRIWNASTGMKLIDNLPFSGYHSWVMQLMFSPNGNQLVAAVGDQVAIWGDDSVMSYLKAFDKGTLKDVLHLYAFYREKNRGGTKVLLERLQEKAHLE